MNAIGEGVWRGGTKATHRPGGHREPFLPEPGRRGGLPVQGRVSAAPREGLAQASAPLGAISSGEGRSGWGQMVAFAKEGNRLNKYINEEATMTTHAFMSGIDVAREIDNA